MQLPDSVRRTKIVATIGPATNSPAVLKELISAGATTLRLNFSHGTHEDHLANIRLIRRISFELNQPVGILQDLQGPKIRLGKFEQGKITLKNGDPFILTSRTVPGSQTISSVSFEGKDLSAEVPEGATILLDDGKVEMKVKKINHETQDLHCEVVVGGVLSNNKGVNFPGVRLSIRALTEKDREDLTFGLDQGVDWIALSFVRNPEDILEIKELIANAGKDIPVIAKIEKHEAIEQMEEILSLCDGVMVARGDLGVELPAEDVPILQKQLIRTANRLGIPIITATQMLDSMVYNPRATRAEISDVANAIIDGTDAVMLSNETAVGEFPVEAVKTMARIALRTEQEDLTRGKDDKRSVPNAISQAVGQIAEQLEAAAIMPFTKTGSTARNVSKFRPSKRILAVTPHIDVARRLQLVWGVRPMILLDLPNSNDNYQAAINEARNQQLLKEGDYVVITSGALGIAGSTDLIKVEVVSAVIAQGVGLGEGKVTGVARHVENSRDANSFRSGDILVAVSTNAEVLEAMKKAKAIVVEDDSLTSHTAVLGLRLGIPVVLGVKDVKSVIRDTAMITLDIQNGRVYAGSKE
jgi:pyruvate kinase